MKNKWLRTFFKLLIVILIIIFIGRAIYSVVPNNTSLNKKRVVVLDLEGLIYESGTLINEFKKYEKDDNVVGFILRINSPGGAVAPSQEIYRHIRSMKKPVFAAMSTVAASGGYYVASACDRIYALPGTITGSIGVIIKLTNFSDLYGKLGVKIETIKSGKFKDIGSTGRGLTEEEKKLLQSSIDDVYNQFVDDILAKRTFIKREELLPYADGRIITGNEAKRLKLVDNLGTYEDAYLDLVKMKKTPDAELISQG